jgi:hypothetical protein
MHSVFIRFQTERKIERYREYLNSQNNPIKGIWADKALLIPLRINIFS